MVSSKEKSNQSNPIHSWHEYLDSDLTKDQGPKYQKARLDLAHALREKLSNFSNCWFLDGGTLLGIWRNGRIIKHDYDFDFALHGTTADLWKLRDYLSSAFQDDKKIIVKSEEQYATKLLVVDTSYGQFDTTIEWWKVYADILLYSLDAEDPSLTRMQYFKDGFIERTYKTEWFFPLKSKKLEEDGSFWPIPNNAEKILSVSYGYLGEDACFDPQTKLYRPQAR
ncbi:MAG: hypothetical protein HQK50_17590 [Oligoflexia bacterium]|nr:hypothetical protein [Oligoflexia bacterium]MBF0367392.1 hypothetical protein [Oligoflexia bacterium]